LSSITLQLEDSRPLECYTVSTSPINSLFLKRRCHDLWSVSNYSQVTSLV